MTSPIPSRAAVASTRAARIASTAAEYALTEWKGVDWNDLYRRHVEAIRVAAATGSLQAYFVALHQYLFDIDDGHVSMPITPSNADLVNGLIRQQSGGGYGLGLAELDDGTVIAARVSPGGPGAIAGIQPGARIVRWGSRDVAAAIDAVDPGSLAAATHMATRIHQRLEQVRLLTRAPVDTTVAIEVAASWKPFMKSNSSANATSSTTTHRAA